MFGLRSLATQELTALRFADDKSFRAATRIAAEARIPVDAPGHMTLVVPFNKVGHFERAALKFERERIADPEKVAAKDYSSLRRRLFGLLTR